MRQRGYEIQVLVLNSTVAALPAELLFPLLPTPNTTAFQFVLNVRLLHIRPRTSSCWPQLFEGLHMGQHKGLGRGRGRGHGQGQGLG